MVRLTLRFPLGVYHAQSGSSPNEPEWPPSPLRLLGALLAAAHGRHGGDLAADRTLLQRLCDAPPPRVLAPDSVGVGEPNRDAAAAVRLRGATRWAPRNYVDTGRGVSPRNLGRERAEVSKVGVAIGDRPVHLVWDELELTGEELERLRSLAADVTFVGTSRSPALVHVAPDPPGNEDPMRERVWRPAGVEAGDGIAVRVPDGATLDGFDRREAARRSDRARVQPTGLIPQIAIGQSVRYVRPGWRPAPRPVDPRWWGEMIVLAIDDGNSQLRPKAPAAYLLARAVRTALLSGYGAEGTVEEAPAILTARGADPHCAVVPLPFVWGPHPTGRVLGVALVLPHERRVADLVEQRAAVVRGLRALLGADDATPRPDVRIPGAGLVRLALPTADDARKVTLQPASYARPSRHWVTVTPVVHSRWRKGGAEGLMRQVAADCAHVGLPTPSSVAVLRGPGRRGGAGRMVSAGQVPERWRGPVQGPADHLALTFERPVAGPLLLGKARHFGLGLCVPAEKEAWAITQQERAA
ncbi:type I-U CRISPR-associated protein Csb2 [Conexibacter stalactiti]|uniref:Type I-U CRISPR-associated protein Csb2 n=1 Tax=Conexibacter stalactiti TaxID=1940611 RepID=A0ABU4HI53_9ACTN|nr:type I-U CRISPR-associated protein Csb2 [Conexibacter stalactiti]MDW5592990.1 type I-U CRISPR-associated protein Csb2 [Conexibacter stalactiti]MEC5033631.1 type I-U CRISPR-associated protein Csb2 [Conexibacter stalactiti]